MGIPILLVVRPRVNVALEWGEHAISRLCTCGPSLDREPVDGRMAVPLARPQDDRRPDAFALVVNRIGRVLGLEAETRVATVGRALLSADRGEVDAGVEL